MLYRPLRGLARSHRCTTGFESCAVPVGAGMPAKRPVQAAYIHQASTTGNQANDSTVEHITRFATCSGSRLARTAIR